MNRRDTKTRYPQTFASTFGQQDNLGDVILRRDMLDALRQDSRLHLYTGTCSPSYIEALKLSTLDKTYTCVRSWLFALVRAGMRGRTVFAFNTGEVTINPRFALSRSLTIPLRVFQGLRGGAILHVGQGIKDEPSLLSRRIGRMGLRACSVVSWRDHRSHRLMPVGVTCPDWAFTEVRHRGFSGKNRERNFLTISLRGDRSYPTDDWLLEIKSYAKSQGLRLAVATQVRRDSAYSQRLSQDLGAELLDWSTRKSHSEQEADLRALYADSVAVVSDRLHVLVVSMAEGATPIDASVTGNYKVRNTFASAGLELSFYQRDMVRASIGSGELGSGVESSKLLAKQMQHLADSVDGLYEIINSAVRGISPTSDKVLSEPR